ncbi:Magnesium-chelatase 60 kDa subunit [Sphingomonas sp. EC-HK361]|uniref:magnesium chelatase subunit D n=1 Tax=Sphingomonas sp. EC-HK361 TaxID=2038397 RepID=UPI001254E7A9|nr:magnesium chelatase subunit D [Sphingomonas sp. EC-HK361]VVS99707.1 Magnesium-chelatase 60 kDa subunit [Sphingomonas sp. EC-HK361]
MTDAGEDTPDAFTDALLAARLCAIDPGLGGMVLRGGDNLRDVVIAELRGALPEQAPMRRLPPHVDDEALLGGLDLGATLASGRAVGRAGLLAEVEGGLIVAPMAERMREGTAARIGAALDGGAQFLTVALDDGLEPDERVPAGLADRLAFQIDLSFVSTPAEAGVQFGSAWIETRPARTRTPAFAGVAKVGGLEAAAPVIECIATTAAALGIDSARAPLFALRAARAAAALAGRAAIADADVILAARLVLAPRATRFPAEADPEATPPPPEQGDDTGETKDNPSTDPLPLDDIVLAATLAALPPDVLARIAAGQGRRGAVSRARGAGERRRSPTRGRPVGVRSGVPRGGLRLSLIDTLRAAAPWQKVRGREGARILIRRDDLRIRRFETRAEALTIFAVDASGSSALARLSEAKGAVELLLGEAYVKRAQVALLAFRGEGAEIVLPPTRSLARARRALADLPGGGGTPLAAGLAAAQALAEDARSRGRTPFVVVLTDGRANVALGGSRSAAATDADAAARAIGASGIAGAFVDISPRPRAEGEALAAAMGARYLALPRADASAMHAAIAAVRS